MSRIMGMMFRARTPISDNPTSSKMVRTAVKLKITRVK
jgi:hypothetical protein